MPVIGGEIIQDINVDNINLAALQQYTPRQMAEWSIRNFTYLRPKIVKMCQELLDQPIPAPFNNGESYPEPNPFISKEEAANLLERRSIPLCHLIPHIAALYHTSCQQFVFPGNEPKMPLRTATANLVRMAADLPDSDFYPILTFLRENRIAYINPLYVVRSRTHDISSEQGETIETYAKAIYSCFHNFPVVRSVLLEDQPIIQKDLRAQSERVASGGTFPYVIAVSMIENVPIDYLLFQDYSHIAVWKDGSELTPRERDFLSSYLMADPSAQTECLCRLCLLRIRRRSDISI